MSGTTNIITVGIGIPVAPRKNALLWLKRTVEDAVPYDLILKVAKNDKKIPPKLIGGKVSFKLIVSYATFT